MARSHIASLQNIQLWFFISIFPSKTDVDTINPIRIISRKIEGFRFFFFAFLLLEFFFLFVRYFSVTVLRNRFLDIWSDYSMFLGEFDQYIIFASIQL